jgi:hypothetical protein
MFKSEIPSTSIVYSRRSKVRQAVGFPKWALWQILRLENITWLSALTSVHLICTWFLWCVRVRLRWTVLEIPQIIEPADVKEIKRSALFELNSPLASGKYGLFTYVRFMVMTIDTVGCTASPYQFSCHTPGWGQRWRCSSVALELVPCKLLYIHKLVPWKLHKPVRVYSKHAPNST